MNSPLEIAARFDVTHLIWPMIWDRDEPLFLPDSTLPEPVYYKFEKGDRVIYPKQVDFLEAFWYYDATFYGGAAGGGKIIYTDSAILTPFGFKKIENVKIGDAVNNPDGSVSRVIQLHPWGDHQVWRVHFHDGTHADVAREHLWLAWRTGKGQKKKNVRTFGEDCARIMETEELKRLVDFSKEQVKKGRRPYWPVIPVCQEQPFNTTSKWEYPIEPYLLGYLLGDGHLGKKSIGITSMDQSHFERYFGHLEYRKEDRKSNLASGYVFRGATLKTLRAASKLLDLDQKRSHNKFIPDQYKLGPIEVRWAILQGLMDTDGTSDPTGGRVSYCSVSKQLAEDVAFIVRSLGGVATITVKPMSEKNPKHRDAYIIYIKHPEVHRMFRLQRKIDRASKCPEQRTYYRKVVDVEILDEIRTGRCITVSHPNGLYITDDFVVTHNSWIGPWAVALYLFDLAVQGFDNSPTGAIFRETLPILAATHTSIIHQWFPDWMGRYVSRPHNEFRFNKEYGSVRIQYRSTDKFDTNERSTAYACGFIDESTNQQEAFFDHIGTRMRWAYKGRSVPHCPLGLASNPVGIGLQWHLRRFVHDGRDGMEREADGPEEVFVEGRGQVKRTGNKFIQALPIDNPALSDRTLANLKKKPPKIRDAYFYGRWGSFEGQFFDLDETAHTFPNSMRIDPAWPRYLALDWAMKHTACAYAGAVDWDGTLWIYEGLSVVGIQAKEFKRMMADLFVEPNGDRTRFATAVADPSMWEGNSVEGNKTPLEIFNDSDTGEGGIKDRHGEPIGSFRFVRADNDRITGWQVLREGFAYKWENSQDDRGRYKRKVITPPKIRIAQHLRYLWMSLTIGLQTNPNNSEDCLKTKGEYGPGEGDDDGETARYLAKAAIKKSFRSEAPQKLPPGKNMHMDKSVISGKWKKEGSIWV
jgi:hypothetical protein